MPIFCFRRGLWLRVPVLSHLRFGTIATSRISCRSLTERAKIEASFNLEILRPVVRGHTDNDVSAVNIGWSLLKFAE